MPVALPRFEFVAPVTEVLPDTSVDVVDVHAWAQLNLGGILMVRRAGAAHDRERRAERCNAREDAPPART